MAHTERRGQAWREPPPGGPASAPPILLCCLHFSGILLWYVDISLHFFPSRKNQLSVSNKVEGDLDVLQLGRYPWGLCACPTGSSGLHLVCLGGNK